MPMQTPPAGSAIMIGPGEPIDMFTCGEGPYAVGPITAERRVRFWPKMDFLAGGTLVDADLAMNAGSASLLTGTLTLSGQGSTFTSGYIGGRSAGTVVNTGTLRTQFLGFTGHGNRSFDVLLRNVGRLEVQAALVIRDGGVLENVGELEFVSGVSGGATIASDPSTEPGLLESPGSIRVGPGVSAVLRTNVEGRGSVVIDGGTLELAGEVQDYEGTISLANGGTLLVTGAVPLDEVTLFNTDISGNGTVQIEGSNVDLAVSRVDLSSSLSGNGLWLTNRLFLTRVRRVTAHGVVSWSQGALRGNEPGPPERDGPANLTIEAGSVLRLGTPAEAGGPGALERMLVRVEPGADASQQGELRMFEGSIVEVEAGADWTLNSGRAIRSGGPAEGAEFIVKGDLIVTAGAGGPSSTIAGVLTRFEGNGRLLLGNTRLEINNLITTGEPVELADNAVVDISTLGEVRLQNTMVATGGSPRWVGSGKLATTGNGIAATFIRVNDGATLTNELSGSTADDGFFLSHILTSGIDDEELIGFSAQFINAGDMHWRAGEVSVACDEEAGDGFTNLDDLFIQTGATKTVASCRVANMARVFHEAGRVELSSFGIIRNEAAYIFTQGEVVNVFPSGRFINAAAGTISKVTPGTTATIDAPLDNQGTVAVVEGTLNITDTIAQLGGPNNNASLNGGRWNVNAGATLNTALNTSTVIRTLGAGATVRLDGAWPQFQPTLNQGSLTLTGTRTFTGGLTISGGGTLGVNGPTTFGGPVRVEGGVVAVNQPLTTPSFTQTGGIVLQTGALRLNGPLTLSGGIFDVAGAVEWGGLSAIVNAAVGTIRGVGQLGGASSPPVALACAGCTLSPGNSPGVLTVFGSVALATGSVVEVEIAGRGGPGDPQTGHDVLVVAGTVALRGTLRVPLLGAFEPVLGDAFTVLTASEITGSFDALQAPVVEEGAIRARAVVESAPEGAAVVVRFVLAEDFNGDGLVNPDDLSDYITAYFESPPGPAADFNLDGLVNPDDLSDYITAYFN
jgi:hypothetical protein